MPEIRKFNQPIQFALPVQAVTAVGSSQATGAVVSSSYAYPCILVVSGANATKAITLPASAAGKVYIIKNVDAAVLPVYPAVGGAINAGATDAAYSMAASVSLLLFGTSATQWYSLPLLGS